METDMSLWPWAFGGLGAVTYMVLRYLYLRRRR
jgi:hypothetical protein